MRINPGQVFHSGGIRYLVVNTSGLTLSSGKRRADFSAMVISGHSDMGRLWPIGNELLPHFHDIPDVGFEEEVNGFNEEDLKAELEEGGLLSRIPSGIPFVARVSGVELMLVRSEDGLVFGMGGNSLYANDVEWESRPVLYKFVWSQKIQGEG